MKEWNVDYHSASGSRAVKLQWITCMENKDVLLEKWHEYFHIPAIPPQPNHWKTEKI